MKSKLLSELDSLIAWRLSNGHRIAHVIVKRRLIRVTSVSRLFTNFDLISVRIPRKVSPQSWSTIVLTVRQLNQLANRNTLTLSTHHLLPQDAALLFSMP